MRDRRRQRLLKKRLKEQGLSPKDSTGISDPTPFEAVKEIIQKEKEKILAEVKNLDFGASETETRSPSSEEEK